MNPSSGNNAYSAADIERYHQGLMSPAERHALEKAALDDPFLADALEGYAATPTPSADVAALRERLFGAKEERPRGGLAFLRSPWLRAAAAIVLLAGAGWFAFRNSTSGLKKETFSDQREPVRKEQPAETPRVSMDTTATQQAASAPGAQERAKAPGPLPTADLPAPSVASVPASADLAVSVPVDTISNSRWTNTDVAANRNVYRRSGPMLNNNANITRNNNLEVRNDDYTRANRKFNSPPPVAASPTLPPIAAEKSAYKDSFAFSQPATALKGKAAGIQVNEAKKEVADTIRNFDVVLQEDKADLNEVVVMGKGIDRKRLTQPQVKVDTLEGAEYAYRFDEYVAENIRMPENIRNKPTRGEVVLSFDVNSQGEPVNIKVAKSLCEQCDEEAIRLLKEGPKWKKKEKKKKVTIKF